MANWEWSINFVLKWETGGDPSGAYTNDPLDAGGETKWGISKRYHKKLDIKNLTRDQAIEIYNREYWAPLNCFVLEDVLALVVFDSAVNCGVTRVNGWLDNSFGEAEKILIERENLYRFRVLRHPDQKKFLKGWLNRLADLRKTIEDYNKKRSPV